MKFLTAILVLTIIAMAGSPLDSRNNHRFTLTGDSTTEQLGPVWPIALYLEKSLRIRVDDTSATNSDSCGFNMYFYGFTKNHPGPLLAGNGVDSTRIAFQGVARLLTMTFDTANNGAATILDTAITIQDSSGSAIMDGNMDIVQITPICCFDSLQVRIIANSQTKTASAVIVDVALNQVDPREQN